MAEEYIISVVIEGSDKASAPLKQVKKQTEGLNTSLINSMVALEGMASGLNQLVGGANKMVGALERTEGKIFGVQIASESQIETLRKWSATLEFIIGPMEMFIALMKIKTVMTARSAQASGGAAAAEIGLTASVNANTVAVRANTLAWLANPLFILAATLAVVVIVLMKMRENTQAWNNTIGNLNRSLDGLLDKMHAITSFPGRLTESSFFKDAGQVSGFGGAI